MDKYSHQGRLVHEMKEKYRLIERYIEILDTETMNVPKIII